MPFLARVGGHVLGWFRAVAGYGTVLWLACRHAWSLGRAPVRQVLLRQVYFSGVEAWPMVFVMGLLIGVVIISQVKAYAGADPTIMGKVLAWTVVKELGALLTAVILIVRSGTAIASELATMKLHGDLDELALMGIDPFGYLIVPRVWGMCLASAALTFYFQIAAVGGGLAVFSLLSGIPFLQPLQVIVGTIGLPDLAWSLVKSLLFGLMIAAVTCRHGLEVRASLTEVPQAALHGVVRSLLLVFLADGAIATVTLL